MKRLNNRGVSLVEMLAVVVILGMLIMIMIPNVSKLIKEGKEERYKDLESSIVSAAKLYISDYKYEVSIGADGKSITKINEQDITDSKIPLSILVNEGNIETTKNGNIKNPKNQDQCLNLSESYIVVTFDKDSKNFVYGDPNIDAHWSESNCK